MSHSGIFKPKFPEKYKGDPTNIIYRSLWEQKLMIYLDHHKDVLKWSSEEIIIPYRSPWDNRMHRYFPDFWCRKVNKHGVQEEVIIEVKPWSQLFPPDGRKKYTPKGRKSRRFIREAKTYAINMAKFEAAKSYCESKDMKFIVMTEKDLQPWKSLKKSGTIQING